MAQLDVCIKININYNALWRANVSAGEYARPGNVQMEIVIQITATSNSGPTPQEKNQ
jgi:hypothetical protein